MPITRRYSGEELPSGNINTNLDETLWTKYQTANQTRTSTTAFLDSPDLVYTLPASTEWALTSFLIYGAGTAGDIQFRFTLSGSGTNFLRIAKWNAGTSATTFANAIDISVTDSATAVTMSAGGIGTGTLLSAMPAGYLIVGSGTGTLQFAFAQNASSGTTTTFYLGSFLRLSRVA